MKEYYEQIYPIFESAAAAKFLQSCLTLSDLMDCSLPGSSIHGIFQARVLEWVAIAFSVFKAVLLKIGLVNMSPS